MPVVIGEDNLPSPVGIGLTDLPNIGGSSGPPGSPGPPVPASLNYVFKIILNYAIYDCPPHVAIMQEVKLAVANWTLVQRKQRKIHSSSPAEAVALRPLPTSILCVLTLRFYLDAAP